MRVLHRDDRDQVRATSAFVGVELCEQSVRGHGAAPGCDDLDGQWQSVEMQTQL
jgi:hypothetical protein